MDDLIMHGFEFERKFWESLPRWTFRNLWNGYERMHSFSLFGFWWVEGGPLSLTAFNFAVEFNPYHKRSPNNGQVIGLGS